MASYYTTLTNIISFSTRSGTLKVALQGKAAAPISSPLGLFDVAGRTEAVAELVSALSGLPGVKVLRGQEAVTYILTHQVSLGNVSPTGMIRARWWSTRAGLSHGLGPPTCQFARCSCRHAALSLPTGSTRRTCCPGPLKRSSL